MAENRWHLVSIFIVTRVQSTHVCREMWQKYVTKPPNGSKRMPVQSIHRFRAYVGSKHTPVQNIHRFKHTQIQSVRRYRDQSAQSMHRFKSNIISDAKTLYSEKLYILKNCILWKTLYPEKFYTSEFLDPKIFIPWKFKDLKFSKCH